MGLWEWSREVRVGVVGCGFVLILALMWGAHLVLEEANRPLGPGDDMFFLNWRNTPRPPIIYQDANGDDLDALTGLHEPTTPQLVLADYSLEKDL